MIQFAIGLILIAMSAIVGTYQYSQTTDRTASETARYHRLEQQKREVANIKQRLENTKKELVKQGDDQRASIEKTLNLADSQMQFKYVTMANLNDPSNRYFYRHEFQITGPSTFYDALKLIDKLENTKGVVLYSACMACIIPDQRTQLKEDQHMVQIKGYLYVYNPATL